MPPHQARVRARVAFWAAVAVASGMTVAAGRIGTDEENGPGTVLLVLATATFALLFTLPVCLHARVERDNRYVTGKTVTGLRTVDLHALTRVWLLRAPTAGVTLDHLVLTDHHGVRLAVDDRRIDAAVRDALRTGRTKVSGGAKRRVEGTVLPLPVALRVAAALAGYLGSVLVMLLILAAVTLVVGAVGDL